MGKAPNNASALAAFVARKSEIDTILARLVALSAEHLNCTPDEITWADVGTLGSYLERLREISDAAFHEGEHAACRMASPPVPTDTAGGAWVGAADRSSVRSLGWWRTSPWPATGPWRLHHSVTAPGRIHTFGCSQIRSGIVKTVP